MFFILSQKYHGSYRYKPFGSLPGPPIASSNKKNREICAICEKKLKKKMNFSTPATTAFVSYTSLYICLSAFYQHFGIL